jgi:hypothetical protein
MPDTHARPKPTLPDGRDPAVLAGEGPDPGQPDGIRPFWPGNDKIPARIRPFWPGNGVAEVTWLEDRAAGKIWIFFQRRGRRSGSGGILLGL